MEMMRDSLSSEPAREERGRTITCENAIAPATPPSESLLETRSAVSTPVPLQPDGVMAQAHLRYLDPNAKGYFFIAIKDKGYTKSWVNKAFDAVQKELIHYNQQGYGIYVTVNEIDSSGQRKAENVTRIRAVFEDNDTPHAAPVTYPLQPSFEVESSPGKFHRYWLVKDEMSQDTFKAVAKSLIQLCHSDPVCKDAPRVLRLAGFYHHKKQPVMTILREAIYDLSSHTFLRYQPLGMTLQPGEGPQVIKYSGEQLTAAFPPLPKDQDESPLCLDYSTLCLAEEEPKIYGAVRALSQDRHILNGYDAWIRCGMAIHSALPDDGGLALWKLACAQVPNYDAAEMEAKWAGLGGYGYTVGTLYYLAQQAGWKYQEHSPPGRWPQLDFNKKPLGLTTEARDGWRLAQHLGQQLVYTQGLGWFRFDGVKLHPEEELENSPLLVNALPRIILKESERYRQGAREALEKHALRLEYNAALTAAIKASQGHLRIKEDALDRNRDDFCCQNGVLNLVTGQLRRGQITDFITQQANAAYVGLDVPDPPLFVRQMQWIFDNDPDVMGFVQKWLGYCLSGRINEPYFPIFHGEGGSGKSVLFESIVHTLGDYAKDIDATIFTEANSSIAREALMEFRGARLVFAAETEDQGILNENFIKTIVGNSRVMGRVLYKGLTRFDCTHKTMLMTNFRAVITGKGKDIWRRVLNVACTQSELAQPDVDLLNKMKAEADLILSWLVRGFQRYLQEGLTVPDKLKQANEAYRDEMNLLKRFIEDCCVIDFAASKHLCVLRSDFTKTFNLWLRDEGYERMRFSPTRVESDMVKMKYRAEKRHGRRIWDGVILKEAKLKALLAALKAQAAGEKAARLEV